MQITIFNNYKKFKDQANNNDAGDEYQSIFFRLKRK